MEQTLRIDPLQGLNPAMVDQINAGVERTLAEAGLGRAARYTATTIVEELCTNILEHSGADWLEVIMASQADRARIGVRDNGKPFDPGAAIRHQAQSFDLGDAIDRRLGLYMMGRLTESFQCSRDAQGCNLIEFEVSRSLETDARSDAGNEPH